MEDFRSYLLSKRIVSEKKLVYYLVWINQFYVFCEKTPGDDVSAKEIDGFAKHFFFYLYPCGLQKQTGSKESSGLKNRVFLACRIFLAPFCRIWKTGRLRTTGCRFARRLQAWAAAGKSLIFGACPHPTEPVHLTKKSIQRCIRPLGQKSMEY